MKRQKYIEGNYFLIPLNNGKYQLGRIIQEPIMVIYDKQFISDIKVNLSNTENLSILFALPIAKGCITSGVFTIVGNKTVEKDEIEKLPPQFDQDLIDFNDCTLVYLDGREVSVSPIDCIGLEALGSWDAEHVIERIENYYDGIPNVSFELSKVKIPS